MTKRYSHALGSKMAGGNPHPDRGRDPDEHYPTPTPVTVALCRRYPEHIAGRWLLEPCAAGGHMASVLSAHGARVICSDIKPLAGHVHRADVLTMTKMPNGLHGIVTNPPWNTAKAIISHILGLPTAPLPFVAMVLKGSFWHAASRAQLFERHRPTAVHPLLWRPDFKNLGAPTMEVIWTVWVNGGAGEFATSYEPLPHPDAR